MLLHRKPYYLNFRLFTAFYGNRTSCIIKYRTVFITSADSGIYVLNNIASRDKSLSAPRWQAVMWGVLMSAVAITLLTTGGLANLQTMTLITALPFSILMAIMCVSLWFGLSADKNILR
ncbi:choline-glycine betaine transporter [Actinobacillus equuli]|nr:choline-glycine betaine transporter [Actinobacillus equuli]